MRQGESCSAYTDIGMPSYVGAFSGSFSVCFPSFVRISSIFFGSYWIPIWRPLGNHFLKIGCHGNSLGHHWEPFYRLLSSTSFPGGALVLEKPSKLFSTLSFISFTKNPPLNSCSPEKRCCSAGVVSTSSARRRDPDNPSPFRTCTRKTLQSSPEGQNH